MIFGLIEPDPFDAPHEPAPKGSNRAAVFLFGWILILSVCALVVAMGVGE